MVHAIDTAGNLLTLSQSYIVDKEAPNLTLSGSNPFNILQGSNFPDPGANWTDNYDGTGFIPYATSGTLNTAVV
ncbi:hypothetical protein FACS1894176_01320 [Bacteroidia bacterium]|nr:hypothetical protein FACS189428_6990 [Clostridia bacterium]GHV24618.1 hypothetical protein FACS1894176_01320 [Bacteroidia bacterium]